MGVLKYKNANGEWVVASAVTQDSNDTIKHSPQNLTEQQKFQACFNIGLNNALKYTEQYLVKEQKEQVQQNIGLNDVLRYSEQSLTEEQIAQVKENLNIVDTESNNTHYFLNWDQSSISNQQTVLTGLPDPYEGMIISYIAKDNSINGSSIININGNTYDITFAYAGGSPPTSGYWYVHGDLITVMIIKELIPYPPDFQIPPGQEYWWRAQVLNVLQRNIPAGKISGGIIEDQISMDSWGAQDPFKYLLRNSKLSLTEESPLANGDILWIYE